MANTEENLVLRTVYLPKELDDELKQLAFARSSSKNALIREAVRTAFETWRSEQAAHAQTKGKRILNPKMKSVAVGGAGR